MGRPHYIYLQPESTVARSSAAPTRPSSKLPSQYESTGPTLYTWTPVFLPAPLPLVLLQSWADHEVDASGTQILVRQPAKILQNVHFSHGIRISKEDRLWFAIVTIIFHPFSNLVS